MRFVNRYFAPAFAATSQNTIFIVSHPSYTPGAAANLKCNMFEHGSQFLCSPLLLRIDFHGKTYQPFQLLPPLTHSDTYSFPVTISDKLGVSIILRTDLQACICGSSERAGAHGSNSDRWNW